MTPLSLKLRTVTGRVVNVPDLDHRWVHLHFRRFARAAVRQAGGTLISADPR